jgi:hypothetical protein
MRGTEIDLVCQLYRAGVWGKDDSLPPEYNILIVRSFMAISRGCERLLVSENISCPACLILQNTFASSTPVPLLAALGRDRISDNLVMYLEGTAMNAKAATVTLATAVTPA